MKLPFVSKYNSHTIVKFFVIIILAFFAGFLLRGLFSSSPADTPEVSRTQQIWTCSMHPQIRSTKPGKCPICFMDLIPLTTYEHEHPLGPRQITFSPEAIKLMEIQTAPVERKFVDAEIRMVGKIDYDETRLKDITAWVPGRIDRLFVDFTGTEVIKGDHMVRLYSPDLISAQAEYLQTLKAVQNIKDETSELIRRSTEETLKAARDKLTLLGLQDKQIDQITKAGEPTDYINIDAPLGGVVIHKHATEGMYVQTGSKIYTIADLSQVWVNLDAYESDVNMVAYQQPVKFTVEAYPGQTFEGKITFKSPILDPKTRTVKLRVNVPNPDGKLKPGMFVRAVVYSKLGQDGVITDPALAKKYTCPMHPSVLKDSPGTCDICGMDLVTVESRGLAKANQSEQPPLVIPASAPLITGKRAVVYVQLDDPNRPIFEGREVVLGPRAGDYYVVEKGLAEGELVVTNGNFKIDSALQIQAKPSMMSPAGGAVPPAHHHDHGQMKM
jgi:Cu(I)/Ag(I) efflux system membrane fusion protein